MQRFEHNHPSLFELLEDKRPQPRDLPRRPARRPPMFRPAEVTRRLSAWGTAAVLTLAGSSGLSLLWRAQGPEAVAVPETPARVLEVAPTARWTPSAATPEWQLATLPPPASASVRPAPPPAAAAPSPRPAEREANLASTEPAPPPQPPVSEPEPAGEASIETVVAEMAPDEVEPAVTEAVAEAPAAGGVAPELAEAAAPAPVVVDLLPPVKLYTPPPKYPLADWLAAVQGDVTLKAQVDESGRVAAVEVLEAPSPGLEKAAVRALERWRFRPATRDGEPVAAHHVQTFRFAR